MSQRENNVGARSSAAKDQPRTPALSFMELDTGMKANSERDLQILRDILLGDYQERLGALETRLDQTKTQLAQTESKLESTEAKLERATHELEALRAETTKQDQSLLNKISLEISRVQASQIDKEQILDEVEPAIPTLVQTGIRDHQEQMVDALYPIMGKLVTRSVTQSMRDLARNIDEKMRTTFSFASFTRNMKARATGVSGAEIAMRDSLPFGGVDEVYLVHQETGLLLQYLSRELNSETGKEYFVTASDDSELITGMLTAFQDFVADAFGEEGEPGSLGDFQHGRKQILIKAARFIYIAVVIQGVAPSNFGSNVQSHVYEIESEYSRDLRGFNGDVSKFGGAQTHLQEIMST